MTRKTICELALVCAVGAMLFGPGLWNRDLWHPLEPNYAQIAHEVVARGSWLQLHLNGEPYYRKPPAFFWLQALCMKAFGLRTMSARLPSVVLGIGGLVLCYLTASKLGIKPLIPSLVLATAWGYNAAAQRTSIDATLSFFVLLSFYLYLSSSGSERRQVGYLAGFAAAVAAAVLAKGPVALLLIALAIFPYLAWRRRWQEFFHYKWAVIVLVVAAVSLAWLLAVASRAGTKFLDVIIGREVVTRLSGDWEVESPWFRYVLTFPVFFLPWFPYLPFAVVRSWKRRSEGSFQALVWFAASFLALSAIPARSDRYLIPLYPAAALIVGAYLSEKDSPAGIVSVAGFAVGSVALVVGAVLKRPDALAPCLVVAIPVFGCSIAGLWFWRRMGYKAVLAAAVVAYVGVSAVLTPYRNDGKSPKPLGEFLKTHGATPGNVVWFRSYDSGVAFYAGLPQMQRVRELKSLDEYKGSWVIAPREVVEQMPDVFGAARPVEEFQISRRIYLVFKT